MNRHAGTATKPRRSVKRRLPVRRAAEPYRRPFAPRRFRDEPFDVFRIIREGDAFDLIPTLSPNTVDLLITSPPYWGHRTYEQNYDWKAFKDLAGRSPEVPPYSEYRKLGGVLGLEPLPEWYIAHLVEILDA